MKNRIRSLFLFLFSVLLLCGVLLCALPTVLFASGGEQTPSLVVLGDSIGTGYVLEDYDKSATPRSRYSWATMLGQELRYSLSNLAEDGLTTSGLRSLLESGRIDAVLADASLVCVTIGGNNLLHLLSSLAELDGVPDATGIMTVLSSLTPEKLEALTEEGLVEAEQDLQMICSRLKTLAPGAKIYFETLYNPYKYWRLPLDSFGVIGDYLDGPIDRYNEVLTSVTGQHSIETVGVCDAFRQADDPSLVNAYCNSILDLISLNMEYDPHPTAKGHALIYDLYLEKMEQTGALYTLLPDTDTVLPAISKTSSGLPDHPGAFLPEELTLSTARGGKESVKVLEWSYEGEPDPAGDTVTVLARVSLPSFYRQNSAEGGTAPVSDPVVLRFTAPVQAASGGCRSLAAPGTLLLFLPIAGLCVPALGLIRKRKI
ncbi:MAG: SGNH/GDSL hydrolase family protein [Clostridia bacterium]|nr:SGNH/GDSL hydrolase family protein [Clostridia bacterium]